MAVKESSDQTQLLQTTADGSLTPSARQFLVARKQSDGDIDLLQVPGWLAEATGLSLGALNGKGTGSSDPRTELREFLLHVINEKISNQEAVLSWPMPELTLALAIQARFDPNLTMLSRDFPEVPGVVALIRDVTELLKLHRQAIAIGAFHGLVGQSLPMLEVYRKISIYGPTEAPVIVTGETGTGKELVARALHERSKRAQGPFVAVNCVALTSELFESELFGHEKGSFTGAYRQHKGRFQRADGGTLFLDEVGDMPMMTQAKMLRALEEGVVERIGSEREERVDVRVLAATNVALEQAVSARRFRADLFHRLSVLRIHVPALRDRGKDIPLLAEHYLTHFNRRYNRQIRRFTQEALSILEEYPWPGNIRELRNVIERLVIENSGEAITARALAKWREERDFTAPGSWNADGLFTDDHRIFAPAVAAPVDLRRPEPPRFGGEFWGAVPPARQELEHIIEARVEAVPPSDKGSTKELTEEVIRRTFFQENGNISATARRLGVHKATLYRYMKELGLSRERLESSGKP